MLMNDESAFCQFIILSKKNLSSEINFNSIYSNLVLLLPVTTLEKYPRTLFDFLFFNKHKVAFYSYQERKIFFITNSPSVKLTSQQAVTVKGRGNAHEVEEKSLWTEGCIRKFSRIKIFIPLQ